MTPLYIVGAVGAAFVALISYIVALVKGKTKAEAVNTQASEALVAAQGEQKLQKAYTDVAMANTGWDDFKEKARNDPGSF